MALYAAVALVLADVLAAVLGLAVGAVPRSWGWAHDELLLSSVVGAAFLASVVIAVLQTLPADRGKQPALDEVIGVRARKVHGESEPGVVCQSGDTLPPRNPAFTGRAEALAEMARLLADGLAVVVRGPMGVGKSQVVREYAHRMRESGRYDLVIWVPADSLTALINGLAALALQLGLPAGGTVDEIAAQVVATLRSRRGWLVVFDNAQRPGDLAEIWPGRHGHVLITSRNRAWGGIATKIDLGKFSRAESVAFLRKRSGSDDRAGAADLAQELDDFPLALAQAAADIDQRSMTIRGYLEIYRDPAQAPILRDAGLDAAEYPASVARTLVLRITQLSRDQPAAAKLLWLCAFLDPDRIDLDLMSSGRAVTGEVLARVLGDPLERNKAVYALAAANLATIGSDGHLQVPRLVQAVIRDELDDRRTAKWARRALNLIKAVTPAAPTDPASWSTYAAVAPHIEAVVAYTDSHPQLAGKPSLLRDLGIYYSASKQLGPARTTFESALAIHQAAGDADQPELAKTLDDLAIVNWQQGDLDKARTNNERARAIFCTAHGSDHPEVARCYGNRGVIQLGLGEPEAARASFERARDRFRKVYGSDHPEVARCIADLGVIELALGDFEAARASFERALASFRKADSPEHHEVARILMNLSLAQRRLGALRAAQASIEAALTIFESAFGPEHLQVATALVNLSIVQRQRREFRAAYTSRKRALIILQAAYGHDYHELSEILINLGILQPGKLSSRLITRALTTGPSPQHRQLRAVA
ncbi:MAG TPA: FxSxx-COOH system tetratricopeptide repeat protein [Streptosporangiaceae bacterium]|nr:FxSxx-COOH system tetratricopeptide repeat protein [Streptosporangiaceae bacterium]